MAFTYFFRDLQTLEAIRDYVLPELKSRKFIKGRLDGCWCILAYDSIHDNFFAGTDYNNTIPIYYSLRLTVYIFKPWAASG